MASSSVVSGNIVAALTCPVCLDICSNPKILPNCGHSLCASCLEAVYKKSEVLGNLVTKFPCPECRTENSVQTGKLHRIKVNYPVKRAVEALQDCEEQTAKKARLGENCPHSAFFSKTNISTCDHCGEKFCQPCLIAHMEFMKLHMNVISSRFHDRLEEAMFSSTHNADNLRYQIDENVKKVHEEIASTSEALVEAFRDAVYEARDRLSKKSDEFGEELRRQLAEKIESSHVRFQQDEIDRGLKKVNEISLLNCRLSDFTKLHQQITDQNLKISHLERFAKNGDLGSIKFTSDGAVVGTMKDLVEKSADVSMETKHAENDDNVDPIESHCQRFHSLARAGDSDQLKAIFSRPNLSLAVKQFLVEHHDESDKKRTILHQAAEFGSLEKVKFLVTEMDANLAVKDENGDMAMHIAANLGHVDVVKFLLDLNPELVNELGHDQVSLLIIACKIGNFDLVRYLVDEKKAGLEQIDSEYGRTALIFAAEEGHFEIVKFLAERGANLLAKGESSAWTALHAAANSGHLEVVKFLFEAHPETVDWLSSADKLTPLHLASQSGHLNVVEYLVTVGKANLETADIDGETPVLLAGAFGHVEVVKFLIESGVNLVAKGTYGETLIHLTAASVCVELATFLFDKYPKFFDVEAKDANENTPLHYASSAKRFNMVKCLVEKYNANVNAQRSSLMTPIFDAVVKGGSLDIVKYLVEHGALLDFTDFDSGENVLHYALESKDPDLIGYLVGLRPQLVKQADKSGETPFQAAIRKDLPDSVIKAMEH